MNLTRPGAGPRPRARARPRDPCQSGTILLVVLFVAIAMSGLIFVGGVVLASYKTRSETEFRAVGQARNVARAGLIDAFSWFRRQSSQPVTAFAPVRDEQAEPPILDTEDPAIGLVREFRISGDVWARYEVHKNDLKHPNLTVRDVSLLRGLPGYGQAWYLVSRGAVYRRLDENTPFNESPNSVLASAQAFTEIRRITLSPPGDAALNATRGDHVLLGTRTRVIGNDGAGVVYPLNTGEAVTRGEISGSPAVAPVASFDASVDAVFGVPYSQLKSLADDVFQDPASFPSPIPRETLVVMNGDITFNDARPLRGTGVVFVDGDCTVDASAKNFFNGLLFVTGDLTFRAPSLLRGTIVGHGTIRVDGIGDYAEIEYDKKVLDALMVTMGQYRIAKAMRYLE